jgi:hypothetical protein
MPDPGDLLLHHFFPAALLILGSCSIYGQSSGWFAG